MTTVEEYKKKVTAHRLQYITWGGYEIMECRDCKLWLPLKGCAHPVGFKGIITNYKKCKGKVEIGT
jgi:hypothetical protein